MRAGALGAAAGGILSRIEALLTRRTEIAGHAKMLARPAYADLLRSEKTLRRTIPILILIFLTIAAVARFAALMDERDNILLDARQDLEVATALLQSEADRLSDDEGAADGAINPAALLTSHLPESLVQAGRIALVSQTDGVVTATLPGHERFVGGNLAEMLSEVQPLLMFGRRAGIQETTFEGASALVAAATLPGQNGVAVMIQPMPRLLAAWRGTVSINVTLFALTATIMLVILYAYVRQATRAQDADALYLETHHRVDTALSRGHCGLWDWDIARGRMYWSPSMYHMLGLTSHDHVLSFGEVAELLHPDDGSLFEVARGAAAGTLDALDRVFRMRRSDGAYIWLRARAEVCRNASDDIHIIGIAVDVSDQQEMRRRSDEAQQRLHNAVENISETFVLCDARDRVVLCNSKYRETFGLTEADVANGAALDRVMARARKPIDSHVISNPSFASGERASEALLPDGRWLLMSERRTADGGFVSIGTDVTQLKLHQARLSDSERRLMTVIDDLSSARREAERQANQLSELNLKYIDEKERAETASKAKTTFLANMSHELRTPLNAILGFSEIMRQETFGPVGIDKYGEYIEDIHQSGCYLLRLINDILDMAKIEAGRLALDLEPVDLGEIARETAKIIGISANEKSVELAVDAPESLASFTDRRATKQILLNLLSNAVKFTGAGGRVRLRVKSVGDTAVITIADSGIGIPESALASLGRPFEQIENELTRTNKGTGLGLAIARSLVELHGGGIRVSSHLGRGTIVAFRLPLGLEAGSASADAPLTLAAGEGQPALPAPRTASL